MESRETRPSFRDRERSRKANLILNGKYIVGEEIGKGASGLVRETCPLQDGSPKLACSALTQLSTCWT